MKKIVIPIDFSSDSINALEHGILFANKLEADIDLLHVASGKDFKTPFYFKDLEEFKGKTEEDYLNLIVYRYQNQVNQRLLPHIIKGNTSKEIIRFAKQKKPEYIMMGTHGTSGFSSYWLGSNAYKVVSASPCPVITIRNGFLKTGMERIVVPIDASKNTRRKIPYAVTMAQLYDAEIDLVGVRGASFGDIREKISSWISQTEEYLLSKGIRCKTDMIEGSNITDMTIEYATDIDADLIVIMTEQDEHPLNFFLGAYAQQMVHHSRIPVLSIRPDYDNS